MPVAPLLSMRGPFAPTAMLFRLVSQRPPVTASLPGARPTCRRVLAASMLGLAASFGSLASATPVAAQTTDRTALPLGTVPMQQPTGTPGFGQPYTGGQMMQPMQPMGMGPQGTFMTGNPMLDAYQNYSNQVMARSVLTSASRVARGTGVAAPNRPAAGGGVPMMSTEPAEGGNTVVQPGAGGGRPPLRPMGQQRLTPYELCVRDGGCPGIKAAAAPAKADSTEGTVPPSL